MTIGDTDQKPDPRSLRVRIAATEEALRQQRQQSALMAAALRRRLRRQFTAPGTLMVAAGLGFTLGTMSRKTSRSLLNLLKTATHASLLFRALG